MLWKLCTLWNIWVCYGKQRDTLCNQTGDTRTESDVVGTVDSGVCVKSLFRLLLSSCLRNWVTRPDHISIVFLTKAKQIKKINFRPEVIFHKEEENTQNGYFSFLVWITTWTPFSSCNGANLLFSIGGEVRRNIYLVDWEITFKISVFWYCAIENTVIDTLSIKTDYGSYIYKKKHKLTIFP